MTSKAQLNGFMGNIYGQQQYSDGTWSGVTIDNKAPIDVEGYIVDKPKPPKLPLKTKRTVNPITTSTQDPTTTTTNTKDNAKNAAKTVAELYQGSLEKESNAKMATAAADFFIDTLNAQAAYNTMKGQAAQNILAARNQAADTLFLGRQAQLTAQSEGYNAGQDATLAMAAQGQDVTGAGVQKIQGSYEAMGIENGMKQYSNAIREALGYDIEEINTKAQLKAAKAARNAAVIGSALKAGAIIATA